MFGRCAGREWRDWALVHGVLIGMLGSGALFGPIIADASLWFRRRRGLAVSIAVAGNYYAGVVWPPIVAAATQSFGWRSTEFGIGVVMLLTMVRAAATKSLTEAAG